MIPICGRCQRPLPSGDVGGNCPACLFGSALADEPSFLPSEAFADEAPTELGDYEILSEIGRGGTSVVYRARQRRLNRIVALKTLHGSALTSRDAFERLQTEAQAVARLDHPNIVPLYEVGRHSGTHFLTLRYFEHGSLAETLKQRRFTSEQAARLLATAARAVHHAHSRGVLHRDLKPSNFLLDADGSPHVADFGLAKLSDVDSSLTLSTSVLGTPAYMAPEQAAGNAKEAGTPADIYALGAILFELLTGRPPFRGNSALEVLRLVADAEPPRPSSLVPGLDRDLEAICLRCLEKDPARRYDSAAALADDLDRWLRHEPLSIRPASAAQRMVKWIRRRPGIAALLVVSGLAVVLGTVGITWQWQRARAAARDARRIAYAAEINSAGHAAEKEDWAAVRAILERTRPKPGEEDLRAWEWRYLWGISRSDAALRLGDGDRAIVSIAALPDGNTVALGESQGGFSLWDVRTGQRTYEFPEPLNRVKAALFHLNRVLMRLAAVPGTRLIAYTDCRNSRESFVQLWDTDTHRVARSIPFAGVPRNLAVSPDGHWLACSTLQEKLEVRIFDLTSDQLHRTIEARYAGYAPGNALAFSPDSRWIAFEGESGDTAPEATVHVVDVATGAVLHRLPQGQFTVVSLAFSPDGRWLASGGGIGQPNVRIWDLRNGQLAHSLPASGLSALAFDAAGQRLFAGLDVWQVPAFTPVRRLAGEAGDVAANCVLPNGEYYLTATGARVLRWDLSAPGAVRHSTALSIPSRHSSFLPQGKGLLLISTNFVAHRAVGPRFECQPIPSWGTNCLSVCVMASLGQVAIGRADGQVTFHDLSDDRALEGLPTSGRPVTGFRWVEAHKLLAVFRGNEWGGDNIEVWDTQTRRLTWKTDTERWMWREAFAAQDGIQYHVLGDGRLVGYDLIRHEASVRQLTLDIPTGVAFSTDGRRILMTQTDQYRLLDAETLQTIRSLDSLPGTSQGTDFWPDGSRWLFANCRIVDPETGRLLLDLKTPFGSGYKPRVSPDGNLVTLISDSARAPIVGVWSAPSWEEIRQAEALATR